MVKRCCFFKMSRPITFKTAFIIVICLHGLAFLALTHFSSLKSQLSKLAWQEKKTKLLNKPTDSSNEWPRPQENIKLVTKASPTPILSQKTKPKVITENKPFTPAPVIVKTILPKSVPPTPKKETAMKFIESKMRETSSPKIVSSIQVTRIGNDIQTETVERRVIRTSFVDSSSRTREITIVPVY